MVLIVAPSVDMLAVSKSSRIQRRSILGLAPKIGLVVVDYAKLDAIDTFYLDCQNMRDYYRDPYRKLPKPVAFKKHYGQCGGRLFDPNSELLMRPVTWVRERQPAIAAIKYDRSLFIGDSIRLGGQYDATSCIKFKR